MYIHQKLFWALFVPVCVYRFMMRAMEACLNVNHFFSTVERSSTQLTDITFNQGCGSESAWIR
jgi:hypothetical protein